jgi:hypothetical protein
VNSSALPLPLYHDGLTPIKPWAKIKLSSLKLFLYGIATQK